MSKSVLYEQDKRIVKITLNRPDTRNALSDDIIDGLVNSLKKADKDKNVGCIILTGAGKSFRLINRLLLSKKTVWKNIV